MGVTNALSVALQKRNVEMVKLLLIHGADPLRCARAEDYLELSGTNQRKRDIREAQIIEILIEAPTVLANAANKVSTRAYKSKLCWEHELCEFYPFRVRQSLTAISEELCNEHFPEEIIHFVFEYFYELEADASPSRQTRRARRKLGLWRGDDEDESTDEEDSS